MNEVSVHKVNSTEHVPESTRGGDKVEKTKPAAAARSVSCIYELKYLLSAVQSFIETVTTALVALVLLTIKPGEGGNSCWVSGTDQRSSVWDYLW